MTRVLHIGHTETQWSHNLRPPVGGISIIRYPGVACYWAERTGRAQIQLRKFMFGLTSVTTHPDETYRFCPKRENGYGCLGVKLTDIFVLANFKESENFGLTLHQPEEDFTNHPDWPTHCDYCGKLFPETAMTAIDSNLEYKRIETNETYTTNNNFDKNTPGMLYDGWWLHFGETKKEDGISLVAVTPNGHHWHIDGPATGGGTWTRTGDPKKPETLTVSPSILVSDYHGFLQNGRFTDDLGS